MSNALKPKVFLNPDRYHPPTKEVWIFFFLTLLSLFFLLHFVNLKPRIDNNFFFSENDAQFNNEIAISRDFARKDNVLIINAKGGDITTPAYFEYISQLTGALLNINGVTDIKSITRGPKNIVEAQKSPLWKRFLIPKDGQSTNVIVLLDDTLATATIKPVEQIIHQFSTPNIQLTVSGMPYIIEMIGRYLTKDIKIFTALMFLIFSIVIWFIFRSFGILAGIMVAGGNACIWTLMVCHLFSIHIGLLTANLTTIVFVLTLSHIIFLTYNWKHLASQNHDPSSIVNDAMRLTFSPSFWSMSTAFLGFVTLTFVPAQPLRELGASGVIGSLMAITAAFTIYPAFLRLAKTSSAHRNYLDLYHERVSLFLKNKKHVFIKWLFILSMASLPGLWIMNTDPSLLSYFSKKSPMYQSLNYIDRNGGSSPLILVVKQKSGEKLNTKESYHQLWQLHKKLELHPAVGTGVSLPVILAEAKRTPLSFFISWDWLISLLELPRYGSIATSFITEDREKGLFLLRMNEQNRTVPRLEIIDQLKKIVDENGFIVDTVGGVYNLQGHLASLIISSLILGLGQLLLIFTAIAWIVSRSIRAAIAITISIGIIPLIVLGMVGLWRLPLDIISSPACNIALGIGIDSMIHMARAYRRQSHLLTEQENWQKIQDRFWQPVFTSTLVLILGFGIFMFSQFPSSQRFGGLVVFGTMISCVTALLMMPALAQKLEKINALLTRP